MMHYFSALLLGISTNLDNMMIGVSYGMRKKRVGFLANLLIGLCSAVVTYLVSSFSGFFAAYGRVPNIVGGCIILFLGLSDFLPKKSDDATDSAQENPSWLDVVLLGAALAVNCIPTAFGAGLTGMTPWLAATFVGGASVLAVAVGNLLGLRTTISPNGKLLDIVGGIAMMALGILQIFL